jgi:hypothetical protein
MINKQKLDKCEHDFFDLYSGFRTDVINSDDDDIRVVRSFWKCEECGYEVEYRWQIL